MVLRMIIEIEKRKKNIFDKVKRGDKNPDTNLFFVFIFFLLCLQDQRAFLNKSQCIMISTLEMLLMLSYCS